ncbi:MAG: nitrous oxide reductase family maturation protein NosD [bacterium]|nr:nitrous oxide reductase family maturation protein NosD [bacterium]
MRPKRIVSFLAKALLPCIILSCIFLSPGFALPLQGTGTFKDIKALEKRIDALEEFETIEVEGHYRGQLTIRKPVRLTGKNVVFDGLGKRDVILVEKTASGTVLDGLFIINSGRSLYHYDCGIKVDGAREMIIKNNRFENNLTAIYLKKSHGSKVLNNESTGLARDLSVEQAGDGIHLFASKKLLIEGNRMFEHRDGTYMEYSHHVDVLNNHYARHLRYGLHYMYSKDNRFEDNLFEDCSTGASIMYTERVILKRNIFRNIRGSRAYGILFKDARDMRLEENAFIENTIALYMDNSHRNIIYNNLFAGNGWVIDIFSSCHGNIIYGNAFIACTYEVSSDIRRTKNHFFHPEKKIGNYWDTYAGYDLDNDGLGDIAHNPVSFFGYLAKRYPDITVFAKSPVAAAIDYAERAMPIVSTEGFQDKYPMIRWTPFKLNVKEKKTFSLLFFICSLAMILLATLAVAKIIKR